MSTIDNGAEQRQQAKSITVRRTLYAAGVGLIPVPILDTAALLSVQVLMIRDISRVYGTAFKEQRVRSLITTLVGDVATVGFFKFIPGLGSLLGGLSGATVGAAATYALGKVFTQHFAQGGTLLSFDPVKSRTYFNQAFEQGQEVVAGLQSKADNNAVSNHDLLEGNKALQAELAVFQQIIADLRGQKTHITATTADIDFNDLQIVEGIGPKLDAALKAGGIKTLQDLAASTSEAISAILENSKGAFSLAVPDSWPEQAALAVKGDLEGLKALQATLTAGRETTA